MADNPPPDARRARAQTGSQARPAGEDAGQAAGSELPSFEDAATRLTGIVAELESGELSLERSLELFEEGVRVARAAQTRLDAAERRVEELLSVTEDGRAQTRELES